MPLFLIDVHEARSAIPDLEIPVRDDPFLADGQRGVERQRVGCFVVPGPPGPAELEADRPAELAPREVQRRGSPGRLGDLDAFRSERLGALGPDVQDVDVERDDGFVLDRLGEDRIRREDDSDDPEPGGQVER